MVCFGAGVQAAFQLCCLAVRALERITVVGRDPGRARAFAARLESELEVPVAAEPEARSALRDTDLVTCATTSRRPVVAGADLRPETHVDAVGAFRTTEREPTARPSGALAWWWTPTPGPGGGG